MAAIAEICRYTYVWRRTQHFKRDGYDLHLEMPVSFAEAALGAELIIPTLDGKAKYKMSAGSQTGTVFQAERQGHTASALQKKGRLVRQDKS